MAANAIDLTTLTDLKLWLNISNSNDDTLLQSLITKVSAAMGSIMNFNPAQATYNESRDGRNQMAMTLKAWPIVSVQSLTIDGLSIPASTATLNGGYSDGYTFDDGRILLRGTSYRFNPGYQNIVIAYTAGFNPIPFDLINACNQLCANWYKERDRIGVASRTLGPETISYNMSAVPANIMNVMNQYTRVFPRY